MSYSFLMSGIVAVVDDLFFVSRVQETAKRAGVQLTTLGAAALDLNSLRSQKPALFIFDLNLTSGDAADLIRRVKADAELREVPIVGFFSHVQVELQRAAQQAGCDQVMPRSKFTALLPKLLQQFTSGKNQPSAVE